MTYRDPYDVRIAFDDLYTEDFDTPFYVPSTDIGKPFYMSPRHATNPMVVLGAITKAVKGNRLTAPPVQFELLGETDIISGDDGFEVLGYSGWRGQSRNFDILGAAIEFPIFSAYYEKFASALPTPKRVRMDTERSYREFRDARRMLYIERFEERLAALENAFAQHTRDGHGGNSGTFLTHVDDSLVGPLREVLTGGTSVALPVAASDAGKIECWQDGPEILCTIRMPPGKSGRPFLATSAIPVASVLDEVMGAATLAVDVDTDFSEIVPTFAAITQILGGERLLSEMCAAAPSLLACGYNPGVGVLSSASDPAIAAAMSLLQRCQRGDRAACEEVEQMTPIFGTLLLDARERLVAAQRDKSRKWRRWL